MPKLKINHTNTYSYVCFCPDTRLMKLRTDWLSQSFLELQWIRKAPSIRQSVEISKVSCLVYFSTYSQRLFSVIGYLSVLILGYCESSGFCCTVLCVTNFSSFFPPFSSTLLFSNAGFTPISKNLHSSLSVWLCLF